LTLQMQAIADAAQMGRALPIQTLSPDNARAQPSPRDAVEAVLAQQNGPHIVEPVGNVQHITFPGPGGPILARVYTPAVPRPYPVMVYFHGGGWVVYNLDTYDTSCRALCNAAGAVVISVNYRLAPSTSFPPRPRTPTRRRSGPSPTRPRSAASRPASRSWARAPEVI